MQERSDHERAWAILRSAGVPIGHPTPGPRPTSADLRAALATALAGPNAALEREALLAWLGALRRHWPSMFAVLTEGLPVAEELGEVTDRDRYLKLRRIALAHLGSPSGTRPPT